MFANLLESHALHLVELYDPLLVEGPVLRHLGCLRGCRLSGVGDIDILTGRLTRPRHLARTRDKKQRSDIKETGDEAPGEILAR